MSQQLQPPAIISFTDPGRELGKNLAKQLGGTHHHCAAGGEKPGELLPRIFNQSQPIIGICATGILVRILAPNLTDKHAESPVISVSADGQHIVPILGGHHGANSLATKIAKITGGIAAITTASDTQFSRGLDQPPVGYELADAASAKPAMAALLNGASIQLNGKAEWLAQAGYSLHPNGEVKVSVGVEIPCDDTVFLHEKSLIVGVGCARGAKAEEIISLITDALDSKNLSTKSIAVLATIALKADEEGLHQAAAFFGVTLRLIGADTLAQFAKHVPNPSNIVLAQTGTPSVAEAAALMAGKLIVEKQKTINVTCAIGQAEHPINVESFGRSQGQVHIVGIGPGTPQQRTGSASSALHAASDWVGYGLYLDLIADIHGPQKQHRFGLGDEELRVRRALELAGEGKIVALVCSGDAQIYAMATLVYELLVAKNERALSDAATRVAIESHPGISAFQMASARAGALIGHDFCCISLSDLLTPRNDIIKRLKAAASGDFVTAFYNPRSERRTELIEQAKAIYLDHRPPETPVIVATNLGRDGEKVRVVELQNFNPEDVDMLTIVMFGSSQSQILKRGNGQTLTFTPRGYASKSNPSTGEEN